MPPDIIFGVYSAYRLMYGNTPADYDKVYVYALTGDAVQARFPKRKGPSNLVVLQADPFLSGYGKTTPPVQTYVDLWNLPDWYAQDFRRALRKKLLTEPGG